MTQPDASNFDASTLSGQEMEPARRESAMPQTGGREIDPLGFAEDGVSEEDLACTHCGGDGLCEDGADPLYRCPDEAHPCHACSGSGSRKDQVIF